jgi:cytochrome P450/NADPH-cytochrome P450 reductase
MPAFSPGNIKGMFDDMFDVATQLVLKWERFGSEHRIDPTDDFTRLALDTIALCSMHYRINSFYTVSEPKSRFVVHISQSVQKREMPAFAAAMGDFLTEAQVRVNRPALVNATMRGVTAKYYEDMKTMNDIVDKSAWCSLHSLRTATNLSGKSSRIGVQTQERVVMTCWISC